LASLIRESNSNLGLRHDVGNRSIGYHTTNKSHLECDKQTFLTYVIMFPVMKLIKHRFNIPQTLTTDQETSFM
jgi:hypothetical protein